MLLLIDNYHNNSNINNLIGMSSCLVEDSFNYNTINTNNNKEGSNIFPSPTTIANNTISAANIKIGNDESLDFLDFPLKKAKWRMNRYPFLSYLVYSNQYYH